MLVNDKIAMSFLTAIASL